MVSEARRRANDRYDRLNSRQKSVRFCRPDFDLVEWAESRDEPFSAYVKRLIREDMGRSGAKV